MTHITEIITELDKMPDWAYKAFEDGQFFAVAFKRVADMEIRLNAAAGLAEKWHRHVCNKDIGECVYCDHINELQVALKKDSDTS